MVAEFSRTDLTTSEEVSEALKDFIKGKTILITGVTPNGLGAYCATALAAHDPELLILASRNAAKIDETSAAIKAKYPTVKTRPLLIDLSSLKSVRAAAAELNSSVPAIDVVINNAAIMACPYATTEDGFESQFGTNHLGHFVLTNEIMPLILAGKDKRIVNISSSGHRRCGVRFDDPGFSGGKEYDNFAGYGQAKTANILFSIGLAERLGGKGVRAYSLHPGGIMTNLQIHIKDLIPDMVEKRLKEDPNFRMKDLSQGSATHIVAAFDPSLEDKNGAYLEDCHIAEQEAWARDPADAEKLWKLSEKLVGKEYNP